MERFQERVHSVIIVLSVLIGTLLWFEVWALLLYSLLFQLTLVDEKWNFILVKTVLVSTFMVGDRTIIRTVIAPSGWNITYELVFFLFFYVIFFLNKYMEENFYLLQA